MKADSSDGHPLWTFEISMRCNLTVWYAAIHCAEVARDIVMVARR
jgi:hypothetical protein